MLLLLAIAVAVFSAWVSLHSGAFSYAVRYVRWRVGTRRSGSRFRNEAAGYDAVFPPNEPVASYATRVTPHIGGIYRGQGVGFGTAPPTAEEVKEWEKRTGRKWVC